MNTHLKVVEMQCLILSGQGEFYVGKTLSVSYISRMKGFNPDDVNVEWYHFGVDDLFIPGRAMLLRGMIWAHI